MENKVFNTLKGMLPDYIEQEWPKGESKERGKMTLALTNFILWARDNWELYEDEDDDGDEEGIL
jgi:hypothetical protein